MKIKNSILLLLVLAAINLLNNSCKKTEDSTYIEPLFTAGTWQLGSVMVFNYIGSTQLATDTFNTTCDTTQLFTFNSNHTCTYTNFECQLQHATGTWSLSQDGLVMFSNISCIDTLAGGIKTGNTQPFIYTKIINIGQYSMVLETGDVNTYFTATTKRRIVQYGFIHQSVPAN